ncbi:MAG: enoyl-CoA hydratase/isomerase family protein [Saprospiraceae bacterium]
MYKKNNDTVLMRKEGKVAVLTLNRPTRYNAITEEMKWGLLHAFTEIQQDDSIKAVVLTGSGKGFCAGADMADLQQSGTADPQAIRDNLIMVYGNVVRMMMRSDKPVIAAINGPVAGAGLGFALACDLRIMANHANMRYAFINIGLVPDNGSTWFLTRQVGYSKALEIIIEGEKIPADECLRLGLTNKVCEADELMDKAMAWANKLANMPTVAIGATKRILNFAMNNDLYNTVTRESEEQMPLFATHDHKEGVTAFVTKRKPNFIGK